MSEKIESAPVKLRTCVVFESDAFNIRDSKAEFLHATNFGDDLAKWLMGQLQQREIEVDDAGPEQEDHGWYFTFTYGGQLYDLVVSYVPTTGSPRWLACLERSHGLLGSLIGQRHRSIARGALVLIHDVLESSDWCRGITWLYFQDVRRGRLVNGATHPVS
jgi:hypothetical protein